MPAAKHPIQELDGIRFYRKPGGYYKADHKRHGGMYMHRYVWERHHGRKPDSGEHVHHINGNKADNHIENLELLPAGAHITHHLHERHSTPCGLAKTMAALAAARAAAPEWHASDAGRQWHSENGARSWQNRAKVELTCSHCGGGYCGYAESRKRGFCSASCQGMARKASGVDDELRECSVCSAPFIANKYVKTRTCGKACWKEALSRARKGVRPDGG